MTTDQIAALEAAHEGRPWEYYDAAVGGWRINTGGFLSCAGAVNRNTPVRAAKHKETVPLEASDFLPLGKWSVRAKGSVVLKLAIGSDAGSISLLEFPFNVKWILFSTLRDQQWERTCDGTTFLPCEKESA